MKYSQNDDTRFLLEEEHRIRKTPHTHTTDVLVFSRKAQGLLCCESHRCIRLGSKFGAKARPPFFVPKSCVLKITTRYVEKRNPRSHFLRRSSSEALTSSQETTSFGCEA